MEMILTIAKILTPVPLLLLILCLCIFWVYQFVQLMLRSDADFPGKYDKCLWTVAFIFAFLIAPITFVCWRVAYKAMLVAQAGASEEEP